MTPRLSIQVSLPCVESARIEETALRPMSSVKRRQNVHLAPAVHDANRRLARDQFVEPSDMLAELAEDNKTLAARLREAHKVCDDHCDLATASLIEVWIDDTERRTWFFSEVKRGRQQ